MAPGPLHVSNLLPVHALISTQLLRAYEHAVSTPAQLAAASRGVRHAMWTYSAEGVWMFLAAWSSLLAWLLDHSMSQICFPSLHSLDLALGR